MFNLAQGHILNFVEVKYVDQNLQYAFTDTVSVKKWNHFVMNNLTNMLKKRMKSEKVTFWGFYWT